MAKKLLLLPLLAMSFLYLGGDPEAPIDGSVQLTQADEYRAEGNYEAAEQSYQQILTSFPGTEYAFQAEKYQLFSKWTQPLNLYEV